VSEREHLRRWSQLHGDVPARGLVAGWVRASQIAAGPLARLGVSPDVISVAGLVVALLALPAAAAGGRWPLLAAALVVLSAGLDSLDGAVAVLSDRVTPLGAVLDQVCDRLAEVAFAVAVWLAGGSGGGLAGWCVAAGGLGLLHEQVRAAARGNGMPEVGVVTISERPTRVIVAAAFLLGTGVYPQSAGHWAMAGAIVGTGAGLAGLVQLWLVVRARLR
jgi:phosphatidylglycerophosphate synthase